MEKGFSTLHELREEIQRLKIRKHDQERAIGEKFSSPVTTLSTAFSLFKGKSNGKEGSFLDNLLSQDLVSTVSRVIVPFIVNKVFFRKSGFITKAVASFISQKAAKNIDTDMLSGLVNKITDFVKRKTGKKSRTGQVDYGIPPDSETY